MAPSGSQWHRQGQASARPAQNQLILRWPDLILRPPGDALAPSGSSLLLLLLQAVTVPLPAAQVQRYVLAEAPEHVVQLHQRMEPLLLFAIDAASFIDVTDPR